MSNFRKLVWLCVAMTTLNMAAWGQGGSFGFGGTTGQTGTCSQNQLTVELFSNIGPWTNYGYKLTDGSGTTTYSAGALTSGDNTSISECVPDDCFIMSVTGAPETSDIWWRIKYDGKVVAAGVGTGDVGFSINGDCSLENPPVEEFVPLDVRVWGYPFLWQSSNASPPTSTDLHAQVFGGVGPYTVTWSPNNGTVSGELYVVAPSATTTYTATVTDATGTVASDDQQVLVQAIDGLDDNGDPAVLIHSTARDEFTVDFGLCDECGECNSGQLISDEYTSSGFFVAGVSNNPGKPDALIAFDSENPSAGNFSYGTPNNAFGGPGIGGGPGGGAGNDVVKGFLLGFAQSDLDNDNDGIADIVGISNKGGTMTFEFLAPVSVSQIDFVNVINKGSAVSTIEFTDLYGNIIYSNSIPETGKNGRFTMPIDAPNAWNMVVSFADEGALAEMKMSVNPVEDYVKAGLPRLGIAIELDWIDWGGLLEDDGGGTITIKGVKEIQASESSCGLTTTETLFLDGSYRFTRKNATQVEWVDLNNASLGGLFDDNKLERLTLAPNADLFIGPNVGPIQIRDLFLETGTIVQGGSHGCVELRTCNTTLYGDAQFYGRLEAVTFYDNPDSQGPYIFMNKSAEPIKLVPISGKKRNEMLASASDLAEHALVFPNPFNDVLNVEFAPAASGRCTVQLFDNTGRLVHTTTTAALNAGEQTRVQIQAPDLAPGIYLYRLSTAATVMDHGRVVLTR